MRARDCVRFAASVIGAWLRACWPNIGSRSSHGRSSACATSKATVATIPSARMARLSYPQSGEARPAALPPEERTIGQLVAETLRIYGENFLRSVAIGVPIAALGLVTTQVSRLLALILAPTVTGALVSAAYVYACTIVLDLDVPRDRLVRAWLVGALVFAPVPFLVFGIILPALLWLAAFVLAVPAVLVDGLGVRAAFARGWRLARADFVHALAAIFTFGILVFLTQTVLVFLLRGTADLASELAFVVANVIISPVLFLGIALLYVDQRSRVE
jgi:hypothetical protein